MTQWCSELNANMLTFSRSNVHHFTLRLKSDPSALRLVFNSQKVQCERWTLLTLFGRHVGGRGGATNTFQTCEMLAEYRGEHRSVALIYGCIFMPTELLSGRKRQDVYQINSVIV